MSPVSNRWAPDCCGDNVKLGFVLAIAVENDGDIVRGTSFQISIVDAVGVTHYRFTRTCPLCNHALWLIRCVQIDVFRTATQAQAEREQASLDEAVKKVREAQAAIERARAREAKP